MKKTLLYIGVALAALAGFASCSSDDELTGSNPVAADNAVIIKASIGEGSAFTRTNPVSDDVNEQTKFNPGDEINVNDGTKDVVYVLGEDGTTWNPKNAGQYLTWHSERMTFKAFYPLKGEEISLGNNSYNVGYISPLQNSKKALAGSDYMKVTSVVNKNPNNHTIDLKFERQMARVIVKIVGFRSQWDVANPTVLSVNIYGSLLANGAQSSDLRLIYPFSLGENQYVALTGPVSASSTSKFISINVAGQTLTVTGNPAMEAGKSYTYNLTVGKDKVTIESVNVEDWSTEDVIPGGEAEERYY